MGGKGRLVEGNLGRCARLNEELAIDIAECPVALVGSGKNIPFWRGCTNLLSRHSIVVLDQF
jgi:hypothetical protein